MSKTNKPHAVGSCPPDCPLVYLCRKCKGHEDLLRYLHRHPLVEVRTVRCQKICESPVAGFLFRGRMEWFQRANKPKAWRAIAELAAAGSGKLPKPLAKRRVRDRSGRKPR